MTAYWIIIFSLSGRCAAGHVAKARQRRGGKHGNLQRALWKGSKQALPWKTAPDGSVFQLCVHHAEECNVGGRNLLHLLL